MKHSDNAMARARKRMAAASRSRITLAREEVMEQVTIFIGYILDEIITHKKRFFSPREELERDAAARVEETVLRQPSDSDYAWLNACYKTLQKYLWARVNREEGLYIKEQLLTSERFAQMFFYGTNPNGLNISRLRTKLLCEIRDSYKVLLAPEEASTIIYRALWNWGDWRPLATFNGEGSIFSWIRIVARREIISDLKKQNLIRSRPEPTKGNMRLNTSRLTAERMRQILDEEPLPEAAADLLSRIYVDKRSDSEIMAEYGWSQSVFRAKVKTAQDSLKDCLIRSVQYYDDVLTDREARREMVSVEFAAEFGRWLVDKTGASSLQDVFGVNLSDSEIQERALETLHEISDAMKWSDNDRYVWQHRFFGNRSPAEVANDLQMRRSNVDNIYLRCHRKFNAAAQAWYEKRNNCKVHRTGKQTKTGKRDDTGSECED